MPKTAATAETPDELQAALDEIGPRNLRDKLARIRQAVPNIEKAGTGPKEQGSYKYMRAEDLCGEIGDRMCLMGISMVPESVDVICHEVIEVTRSNGNIGKDVHVIIVVKYCFHDSESDEKIYCTAVGEGRDTGDKATNKAMTGAKKYALSQALTLRVGEDSEADESIGGQEHRPAPPAASTGTPAPARAPSKPATPSAGGPVISDGQSRRMFGIAGGDKDLLSRVCAQFGYRGYRPAILVKDYEKICAQLAAEREAPPATNIPADDEDLPFKEATMDFGNPDAGLSGAEMNMKCLVCGEIYEDHNDDELGHEFVEEDDYE